MVKRIKVSRQGFTRCPGCSSHIKVAAPLNETVCPFCSAALVDAVAEGPFEGALRSASRVLMTGRSGLIAASLLGATTIGACSTDVDGGAVESDAVVDAVVDAASEDASATKDANEAFDVSVEEDADASPIAPLYGAVPVDVGESVDVVEPIDVPAVEDAGVVDAGPADVEADVADTPQVQPLYGAVPIDAFTPIEDVSSGHDAADSEEVTDPPVQPLYGATPSDGE
jgi:hypothetical protein